MVNGPQGQGTNLKIIKEMLGLVDLISWRGGHFLTDSWRLQPSAREVDQESRAGKEKVAKDAMTEKR